MQESFRIYTIAPENTPCGFRRCGTDKNAVHVLTTNLPVAKAGTALCSYHSPYDVEKDTHNRQIVSKATVPGTPVEITVRVRRADKGLAEVLRDKPGTGAWVDQYVAVRETNGAGFVNYLLIGAQTEADARKLANQLWSNTVANRNAREMIHP